MITQNKLVAHRGDPFNFPENTVAGVGSAVEAGATWAEVDIQYTADFVPLLYHDSDLQRISGDPRKLNQSAWPEISKLPASYPARFGKKYSQTTISTFSDLVKASASWPTLKLFIELKSESINCFGVERIANDVCQRVTDLFSRNQVAAIISKHAVALRQIRERSGLPIGWVVPDHDLSAESRATEMDFEFLFINQNRFESWQAGHQKTEQWVVYTVNDLHTANVYLDTGADMIETDVFGELSRPSKNGLESKYDVEKP